MAVASESRLPELPDIPTMKESGLPGYVLDIWFGAFLPGATPNSIVRTLNSELNRVVMMPGVVQSLKSIDAVPMNKTPEEFTAFFHRQLDMWRDVIQRSGYVPE